MAERVLELQHLLSAVLHERSSRCCAPVPRPESLPRLAELIWNEIQHTRLPLGTTRRATPDTDAEKRFAELAAAWCPLLDDPGLDARTLKQLVQGCAAPPFSTCRDSYLTGLPRRDATRCAERLSGAHCVDCPLIADLEDSAAHRERLRREWATTLPDSDPAWRSLLPESWTKLRKWVERVALEEKGLEGLKRQ